MTTARRRKYKECNGQQKIPIKDTMSEVIIALAPTSHMAYLIFKSGHSKIIIPCTYDMCDTFLLSLVSLSMHGDVTRLHKNATNSNSSTLPQKVISRIHG